MPSRVALGVLSLVKKHVAVPLDSARQAALEVGYPDYRFVKKWLERHPSLPLTLRQVDPLIRGLVEYREYANKILSTPPSP